MHITPPADDYGLQQLKTTDAHREVKETGKVEAYPRIASSEERHEPKEPLLAERRRQERRKRERRRLHSKTTLDTRQNQEQRQQSRRQGKETADETPSGPHGIDDFA